MAARPDRRLERSCTPPEAVRLGTAYPGLERIEARFTTHRFAPHRHDTYAIGFTVSGVQSFDYRGASRASLPGQVFVLHPDELHDGRSGTEGGFGYRILYVEPALIRDAIGPGRPLPFVPEAVTAVLPLRRAVRAALDDLDAPLDPLEAADLVVTLADALCAADPSLPGAPLRGVDRVAVARARDRLDASDGSAVSAGDLEAAAGIDRYRLSRQFRAAYGTSPHRYLIMRRLDRARRAIVAGTALADVAADAGFADQSHLTRQFKRAYGVAPGAWARMVCRPRESHTLAP